MSYCFFTSFFFLLEEILSLMIVTYRKARLVIKREIGWKTICIYMSDNFPLKTFKIGLPSCRQFLKMMVG